ncbi:hypothetical protein [Rhodopirellula sp. MGV]|uniref:hypothetical protein n=1 Tax=Rhodopirellula sp. MGV TaxID=2023130 RepID=UPI000B962F94|nr:hypothetical protein [Rhodopirellula sp. MGV]OYP36357.1 hypothetical protein CGZ80_08570 [Rhodopirellula sp. MGV]PNY38411.1 hypothetical protein C2E31_00210 [Rhodopirellula baltica]
MDANSNVEPNDLANIDAQSEYLRPPVFGLWQWQEAGDVLVWNELPGHSGEQTAAMVGQLHLLLGKMADSMGRLPSLTAVLFVLDACRDQWDVELCTRRLVEIEVRSNLAVPFTLDTESESPLDVAAQWFADLHSLPADLRHGIDAQAVLLEFVLHQANQRAFEIFGDTVGETLAELSLSGEDREANWGKSFQPYQPQRRVKQFWSAIVAMSSIKIDEVRLRAFHRTAVASLPSERGEQFDRDRSTNPIAKLLNELKTDAELAAIAKAAMDVSSLLSIPRRPSDPMDLPIGGVSDVVNRGDPERLLMTELAQPPLVLLARIATGQALYLRRETPPGPTPQFRPVLIESTIRMWGNRRCQALAIALAIGAIDERQTKLPTMFWTLQGKHRIGEDLTSRDGVIKQLERLGTAEHPGDAMRGWLDYSDQSEDAFAEPIVIVSQATMNDSRFRVAFDRMPAGTLIVMIEFDQTVRLLRHSISAQEMLQTLSVEIDHQVQAKPKQVRLDTAETLYIGHAEPPLRTSDTADGMWLMAIDEQQTLAISADRRLLLFDRPRLGAIELHSSLPARYLLAYEVDDESVQLILQRDHETHFLIELCLPTGKVSVEPIEQSGDSLVKYVIDRGAIFRIGRRVELIDQSGKVVDHFSLRAERLSHIGGPVVASAYAEEYYVLSSQQGRMQRQRFSCKVDRRKVVGFVRNISNELVPLEVGLDHSGTLDLRVVGHSLDRQWFSLIASDDGQTAYWLNQKTREALQRYGKNSLAFHESYKPSGRPYLYLRQLLTQVNGVRVASGSIEIRLKGRRFKKMFRESTGHLVIRPTEFGGAFNEFTETSYLQRDHGRPGWRLRTADFGPNRILFDSRGMLHLIKSSDQSEMTLVLNEECVSGWTSWGEVFGEQYFTGLDTCPPSDRVFYWLNELTRQCQISESI